MPEVEGNTSVIDMEGTFRTLDVELPEAQEVPKVGEEKPQKNTPSPKKTIHHKKPDTQAKLAELNAKHKDKIQQILKKHAEERKLLQSEIKAQARRSREDLSRALKQTEKSSRAQLEQLRSDYETRTVELQNELKGFLGEKMTEIKIFNQDAMVNESREKMEKLQEWLHGEFVTELQNKTNELGQVKASTDVQVQNLVQEVDRKNQEILSLQNKIKEISIHLKKDLREELYDEMGFKEETHLQDKKKKKQKKGLFGRFGSMF
jgi:hypothetical protein